MNFYKLFSLLEIILYSRTKQYCNKLDSFSISRSHEPQTVHSAKHQKASQKSLIIFETPFQRKVPLLKHWQNFKKLSAIAIKNLNVRFSLTNPQLNLFDVSISVVYLFECVNWLLFLIFISFLLFYYLFINFSVFLWHCIAVF